MVEEEKKGANKVTGDTQTNAKATNSKASEPEPLTTLQTKSRPIYGKPLFRPRGRLEVRARVLKNSKAWL